MSKTVQTLMNWFYAEETWEGLRDYERGALTGAAEEIDANNKEALDVLEEILGDLRKDAPGTPLNNHKYDMLGIRAYDVLRKMRGI